jgi:hypothetical protein
MRAPAPASAAATGGEQPGQRRDAEEQERRLPHPELKRRARRATRRGGDGEHRQPEREHAPPAEAITHMGGTIPAARPPVDYLAGNGTSVPVMAMHPARRTLKPHIHATKRRGT